ncbi:MAG: glycosyltransferase [Kiritimatiellia bacterium]
MRHPSVEQLGMVTSQRLQAEMSRAWALVLPSRADTSPNVVKEARVVGLPVVVSPHGGHAGYVEDGVDGRIVGTGDPDDWFAALDGLGRDLDTVRGMGRARHAFYRDYFRPERTASEFVRLYRDMVKG